VHCENAAGVREEPEVPTDYDSIAKQYRDSKHADWRVQIEIPSFMRLVGDVRAKSVLDLACGEGFYSRHLIRWGAARVVGVDSSPAMVALARAAERAEPVGVIPAQLRARRP
jgi:trans-aconitate methyltransferase